PLYVFRAVNGIPVEFAFDPATVTTIELAPGRATRANADGRTIQSGITPGTGIALTAHPRQGSAVRIVVLSESQAEQLWVMPLQGRARLLFSEALLYSDDGALELRSMGNPHFRVGVFPALAGSPSANPIVRRQATDGIFQVFSADAPVRSINATLTRLREAQTVPPIAIGGPAQAALQPYPEVFGKSAAWSIAVPADAVSDSDDAYLQLDYVGDVARLFSGTELIDDGYFNGLTWEIGLKRFASKLRQPLTLTILPLRQDAPIYLEPQYQPALAVGTQQADIVRARVVPEYRLRIE
ncbi:MAG TPA: hypothetical protein VII41_00110, partial [Steroidobacteraceae bacterium]